MTAGPDQINSRGNIAKRRACFSLGVFAVCGMLTGNRTLHHVGLPWHWGYKGITTGVVANNLSALVGDTRT
jgi:hypothetical protein